MRGIFMKSVSFVIPCYCSKGILGSVVQEITDTMRKLSAYQYEVILINDCSPDDTFSVIMSLAERLPHIIGIDLAKNFGQHAALMAGFHQASGDIIVCLDDDGQTPANEVGKLLEKLDEGYDVVYASYTNKQHSSFRNWGSRVNGKMAEVMLGKPRELSVTSYFAMRRFVMEEMLRYRQCYPYVMGLVLRTTQNVCNVEVQHRAREEGQSGYTIKKLLALWMNGFTSFSVKPLRMATFFGTSTAGCGFLYLLNIITRFFTDHTAPMGWSSTMAVLLLLGGIILLVLGLLGEYVGRIFMCTNSSPQYVVRRVVVSKEREVGVDR